MSWFPEFESLPSAADVAVASGRELLGPRPAGEVPTYGVTRKLSVVYFFDLQPRFFRLEDWEKLGIVKVTGEGWTSWHPLEPGDRDAIFQAWEEHRRQVAEQSKQQRQRARNAK